MPRGNLDVSYGLSRVGGLPLGARLGLGWIEVGADAPIEIAQVRPQVVGGRPAPEPVPDVDPFHDESWRNNERVRNHGVVVMDVGVLVDVEVPLHFEVD